MNVTSHVISGGNAGVHEIINAMLPIIRQGPKSPLVMQVARQLARSSSQRQNAVAIKFFVKRVFRYVDDPTTEEHLEDADYLLRQYAIYSEIPGDCDEVAILAGSLGVAVGIPVELTALAFAPVDILSHVYVTLCPNDGSAVDIDITRPATGIPPIAASLTVEV